MISIGGNGITVTPHWDDISIRRENGQIRSATLRYNIMGSPGQDLEGNDADDALNALSHPIILGNLYKIDSNIERIDKRLFEGVVEYEFKNTVDYTLSFDTTGGSMLSKQSYKTVGSFAPPGMVPPNYNGAIEVRDGDITGCEIIVPSLSFTLSQTRNGMVTMPFIKILSMLTGRINSQPFLVFNPGDVLFEGASGAQNYSSDESPTFDMSLKFKVSPSIYNLKVGNINVGYKRGWDYFWIEHRQVFDDECVSKSLEPRAAYIEQVYESADMNILLEDFINGGNMVPLTPPEVSDIVDNVVNNVFSKWT
jgi:hypothetical protein